MPQGIYPVADGYIDFTNAGLCPDRVADMLNHAEWLNDPRFDDPIQRMDPYVIEEWNGTSCSGASNARSARCGRKRGGRKCSAGPLFTMQDMFEDDHFRDRGFWHSVEHADLGEVEMPGRPFIMGKGGWEMRAAGAAARAAHRRGAARSWPG